MILDPKRPVYESLLRSKESGEKLDWNMMATPELIERLFCEEEVIEGNIADLFDVEQKKVTAFRRKFKINTSLYRTKKIQSYYREELSAGFEESLRYSMNDCSRYPKVEEIVGKIDYLSDVERKVLIQHLIKNDELLSKMEKELINHRAFLNAQKRIMEN